MTITYLKYGKPDVERAQDDAKTKIVVEQTLKDIEVRGDAALREFSAKFDNYTPDYFRLSERELADIKFAQ